MQLSEMKPWILVLALTSVTESYLARFYLFTPLNQDSPVIISAKNATKFLRPNLETFIFLHGYHSSQIWYQPLRKALFSRGECNIIQSDYEELAQLIYPKVVLGVPKIADEVAFLINALARRGFSLKNIHLVGHSLGGQIAGFVGKYVKEKYKMEVERITATDPAGPLFENSWEFLGDRLNSSDANVVLVIHTDRHKAGYNSKCGTVDIYPNDGVAPQPGCSTFSLNCSHKRAMELLIDAVAYPRSLIAVKCGCYQDFLDGKCNQEKQLVIGMEVSLEDRGEYYLRTTAQPPFKSL